MMTIDKDDAVNIVRSHLWLSRIYFNRGMINDALWPEFAKFCMEIGAYTEPAPGVRLDGRDPWAALFEDSIKEILDADTPKNHTT